MGIFFHVSKDDPIRKMVNYEYSRASAEVVDNSQDGGSGHTYSTVVGDVDSERFAHEAEYMRYVALMDGGLRIQKPPKL